MFVLYFFTTFAERNTNFMKKDLNSVIKEIKNYCQLNNIVDSELFVIQCLTKGFNIAKYGTSPMENHKIENNIDIVPQNDKVIEDVKKEEIVDIPKKEPKKTSSKKKITIIDN